MANVTYNWHGTMPVLVFNTLMVPGELLDSTKPLILASTWVVKY